MLCISTERSQEQGGVRIAPAVFSCPLSRCTAAHRPVLLWYQLVWYPHRFSLCCSQEALQVLAIWICSEKTPAETCTSWNALSSKSAFLFKKEMCFKTPGKVLNSEPGARHFLTKVPIRDLQRKTLWVQAVQHLGSRWGWWSSWMQGSCSSPFLLHRSLHLGILPPPDPCSWPPNFLSQQLYFSSSSFEKYQN